MEISQAIVMIEKLCVRLTELRDCGSHAKGKRMGCDIYMMYNIYGIICHPKSDSALVDRKLVMSRYESRTRRWCSQV